MDKDLWLATCVCCGRKYRVQASYETEAVAAAEEAHEEEMRKATAFRCDMGPMITHAFNLTRPNSPLAPREW